jgi:hypothetical protein
VFDGTVPQLEVWAFHVTDPLHTFVDEHEAIDTAMTTIVAEIEMRDLDVDTTASCPILGFLSTTPIGCVHPLRPHPIWSGVAADDPAV